MAKPKEIRVTSLTDYAKHVESLLTKASDTNPDNPFEGHWYRGVGRATKYTLRPGLFRHPTVTDVEGLLRLEAKMLKDFQRHGVLHTEEMGGDAEEAGFRMLFFMQHYGIPTRLLDWSTNPFIALYFALCSATRNQADDGYAEDAAVWVLNPVSWNEGALRQVSHGNAGPLLYTDANTNYGPRKLFADQFEPSAIKSLYEKPACILGFANNARMFAQRGVFTIFGRSLEPMEIQISSASFAANTLTKLVIPKNFISPLLKLLLRLGYTDSVSFPDLHGLSMEIKRTRGFKV